MASVIPAAIGAGTSLLSGILGKNAAKKATNAQTAAINQALAQQQGQFNTTQANFAPFIQGGGAAIRPEEDLLGINGDAAQGTSIDALKASPLFQSQYSTGIDSILQNAAATGGLRGGNLENGALPGSLPGFSSNLLAQVIQQQLGNLSGLGNMGVGAAGAAGGLGQQNANAQSSLFGNLGNTQASGILGSANITNNTLGDLSKILQTQIGQSQTAGGLGSIGSVLGGLRF